MYMQNYVNCNMSIFLKSGLLVFTRFSNTSVIQNRFYYRKLYIELICIKYLYLKYEGKRNGIVQF